MFAYEYRIDSSGAAMQARLDCNLGMFLLILEISASSDDDPYIRYDKADSQMPLSREARNCTIPQPKPCGVTVRTRPKEEILRIGCSWQGGTNAAL